MLVEDFVPARKADASAVPPPSATHPAVALAGLVAFLGVLTFLCVSELRPEKTPDTAFLVIILTGAAIFATDMIATRVHLKPSTGLRYDTHNPSIARTSCKLLGACVSVFTVGAIYWLAPEYEADFYTPFFDAVTTYLPYAIVLAPVYFYYVDSYMVDPHDGYWHLGSMVLLKTGQAEPGVVVQHLLGWLVKGFFLPLMFVYLCRDLDWLFAVDFGRLNSFALFYGVAYKLAFLVDVGLATVGYLLAVRIFDTHIRTAEPTLFGWLVAVICYEPFASLVMRQYFDYSSGLRWDAWLADNPFLSVVWGCAILLLVGVYAWSTVMFGARFSNLTHRGIITSGPYRWTRHPAYIAKNLSWWLIYIPFVPRLSAAEAIQHCLLLVGVNIIYLLRAKTEERHLAVDPDYRAYSRFIREHGLFRFLARIPLRPWRD